MPAPLPGVDLSAKLAVTKFLSGAGANIAELNTVRKALSRIKGGGMARSCSAGRMDTLIISDVLGDPLDIIASGPTVPNTSNANDALSVLRTFDPEGAQVDPTVYQAIESQIQSGAESGVPDRPGGPQIIGNLALAVDAAGVEAEKRGYSHAMDCARDLEGDADPIGRHHARLAWRMRREAGPDCLITGGEPTVELAPPDVRGLGGRNQQLVLAAFDELQQQAAQDSPTGKSVMEGICLLSGGTDGEDGPTKAAGGWVDVQVEQAILSQHLNVRDSLAKNDAYHLLERAGGLLMTGPTHTNVCDLRVAVVDRIASSGDR